MSSGETPKVSVNDIGSMADFLAAIDETIKYFNDGDIVEGRVVAVGDAELLIDIGYASEGVVVLADDGPSTSLLQVGSKVEALVISKDDDEGRLLLSVTRARAERAWGAINEALERHLVLRGVVTAASDDEVLVDLGVVGVLQLEDAVRLPADEDDLLGTVIEVVPLARLDEHRVLITQRWLD